MAVAGTLRFGGWVKGVWGQADCLLRLDVDWSVGGGLRGGFVYLVVVLFVWVWLRVG